MKMAGRASDGASISSSDCGVAVHKMIIIHELYWCCCWYCCCCCLWNPIPAHTKTLKLSFIIDWPYPIWHNEQPLFSFVDIELRERYWLAWLFMAVASTKDKFKRLLFSKWSKFSFHFYQATIYCVVWTAIRYFDVDISIAQAIIMFRALVSSLAKWCSTFQYHPSQHVATHANVFSIFKRPNRFQVENSNIGSH